MKSFTMEISMNETYELTDDVIKEIIDSGYDPDDEDDLFEFFREEFEDSIDVEFSTDYWINFDDED